MLALKFRLGDDVYVGDRQIIVHRASESCLTVLTDEEEIDVPFNQIGTALDTSTRMYAETCADDATLYRLGFQAPPDVLILTGRNYRRSLDAA